MRGMRRKEKAIESIEEMKYILQTVKHITVAMCEDNVPYLVTLSHGYDPEQHRIYFHCASEGKKIDILKKNNIIWGQALMDEGYVQGSCDHLYATTQFKGKVTFIEDFEEKKTALQVMIRKLDNKPEEIEKAQLTEKSISRVAIGKIDIEYMSGKRAKDVVISL